MKIKLIDFGAKNLPKRGHYNDAGADVYATKDMQISPGQTRKMPLGFGIQLPDGYMAVIHSRSSMAAAGITAQNAPIDSGYRGELHAILTNDDNTNTYKVKKGDRVAQIVVMPIILAEFEKELGEERGEGGFGSTGK